MDSLQIMNMEIPSRPAVKKRRKRFETRWVKLKLRWVRALRQSKSVSTYQLAPYNSV